MNRSDTDLLIDAWLRQELDTVPDPTRALAQAIDAAAVTPQRRGRLLWLRQLLGLESGTIRHGHADRPEVVLTPAAGSGPGSMALGRQGVMATPIALVALVLALVVLGAGAWLAVGAGRDLLGGSDGPQPLRPIEQTGPNRAIVVDPVNGHFASLAEAVAEAQPGDRIELHPGTYQAEVIIDKDIAIEGVGARDEIIVEPLPLAEGERLTDRRRVLFRIDHAAAILRGFTLLGSDHGTAVLIDGGAPTLEDLLIDPAGDMATSGPNQPREAMEVRDGGSPTIRDSVLKSLAHIDDGATPTFEGVEFRLGCLHVQGKGTSPSVRASSFVGSDCPGFSISVADGAHVSVAAGDIDSRPGQAGIRVANDGSSADITGTSISGGAEGVLVGPGATVTFQRSNAQEAAVGIKVQDGELTITAGALVDNTIGLQVSGDSFLEVSDTDFCNETDFDLRDGATVPSEPNRVCDDGTTGLASTDSP